MLAPCDVKTVEIPDTETDASEVIDTYGYKIVTFTVDSAFSGTQVVPKGHALKGQSAAACGSIKSDGNVVVVGVEAGETGVTDTYAAALAGVNTLLVTSNAPQSGGASKVHVSLYR